MSWARKFTGDAALTSVDRGDDRRKILDSLQNWLDAWIKNNTIARFDSLPDAQLNTAVWKLAAGLKRSFGAASSTVEKLLNDEITLVDCLKTIAEIFSDSESEYERKTEDLAVLNKYVLVSAKRTDILVYVASADWTGVDEIDEPRRELLSLLIGGGVGLNGANDRVEAVWSEFYSRYAAQIGRAHV